MSMASHGYRLLQHQYASLLRRLGRLPGGLRGRAARREAGSWRGVESLEPRMLLSGTPTFTGDPTEYTYALDGAAVTVTDTVGGRDGTTDITGADDAVFNGVTLNLVIGDDNANTLNGTAGADLILGFGGNDTVNAGDGADYVFGGDGDDTIVASNGLLTVVGGNGYDTLSLAGNDAYVATFDGTSTVEAITASANRILWGTSGDDVLDFRGVSITGSPLLLAGAGDDILYGSDGDDRLCGGGDTDVLYGGSGDDTFVASPGYDTLYGEAGSDTLDMTAKDAYLTEFDATTSIEAIVGSSSRVLWGTSGDDVLDFRGVSISGSPLLHGHAGNDILYGGDGDDRLCGGGDTDVLYGGSGDDTFVASPGYDTLYGEAGSDTLDMTAKDAYLTEFDATTSIEAIVGSSSRVLWGTSGDDVLDFRGVSISGSPMLLAGVGDDILYGSDGNDVLAGGPGDDVIYGGGGDDTFLASLGYDTLYGEAGSDTLDMTAEDAYLTEFDATTSIEAIVGSSSRVLWGTSGDDVLDFRGVSISGLPILHGHAGNDTLYGSDGDDRLCGGGDTDVLYGGGGDDTFLASPGYDTLYGEAGSDTLDMTAKDAYLTEFNATTTVEAIVGSSSGVLWGTSGDDVLDFRGVSITGSPLLHGHAGNDTLYGSDGDDVLVGGPGDDVIYGGAGDDTLDGGDGVDALHGEAGTDTLYSDTGVPVPASSSTGSATAPFTQPYSLALSTAETDPNATWEIAWGDTQTTTVGIATTSVQHTYATAPASYVITASISAAAGSYSCEELAVDMVAPTVVVDAGADIATDEGGTVNRTIVIDYDGNEALTATVTYGDGEQEVFNNVGASLNVSHTYADSGDYTMAVSVSDGEVDPGTDEVGVTVANVAPTATFTCSGDPAQGQTASIAFADPSDVAADEAAGFTYSYDFDTDGTFELVGVAADMVIVPNEYVLGDGPTITITGRITDKDGGYTDYTVNCNTNAIAATATWDAGGDGMSWDDAANWAGDVLPGVGDTVHIAVGHAVTISGSRAVSGLINEGSVTVATGGSLTINDKAQLTGTTTVAGGTLLLDGQWTNTGTLAISSGTLTLDGAFTTADLGTLSRTGGQVQLTGVLNNYGQTFTLSSATTGDLTMSGGHIKGGVVASSDGAMITATDSWNSLRAVQLDADLHVDAASFGTLQMRIYEGLTLNGAITVGGAWGEYGSLYFKGTQQLAGTGEIVLQDITYSRVAVQGYSTSELATLTIAAGVTVRGQGAVESFYTGDTLINHGTLLSDTADRRLDILVSDFENHGTLAVSGGTLLVGDEDTQWTHVGSLSVTGGTLKFEGYLDNTGRTTTLDSNVGSWLLTGHITGGVIDSSGTTGLTCQNGYLHGVQIDGSVSVAENYWLYIYDGLAVDGTLTVEQNATAYFRHTQTLSGTGQIVLADGTMRVSGDSGTTDTLTLDASITVSGYGEIAAGAEDQVINNGTLHADTVGLLAVVTDVHSTNHVSQFTNNGTLRVTTGTIQVGQYHADASGYTVWTNNGSYDVSGGVLKLHGLFTTTGFAGSSRTGGEVQLAGRLDNTGQTLTLDSGTGSWALQSATGHLIGGVVNAIDGAELTCQGGYLHGVQLDSDIAIPSGVSVYVFDGLTVNGTLTIEGALRFRGDQTLSGTGQVVLSGGELLAHGESGGPTTTLTIAAGVTVTGHGTVGGVYEGDSVINGGAILAAESSTPLMLNDVENLGTVGVSGVGAINLNGRVIRGVGAATSSSEVTLHYGDLGSHGTLTYECNIDGPFAPMGDAMAMMGEGGTLADHVLASDGLAVLGNIDRDQAVVFQAVETAANGGRIVVSTGATTTLDEPSRYGSYRISGVSVDGADPVDPATLGIDGDALNVGSAETLVMAALREMNIANATFAEAFAEGMPVRDGDGRFTLYVQSFVNPNYTRWHVGFTYDYLGPYEYWGANHQYTFEIEQGEAVSATGTSDLAGDNPNANGGDPASKCFSADPIRYHDGAVFFETTDLVSHGYGEAFGQTRSWTNLNQFVTSERNGVGMVLTGLPSLVQIDGSGSVGVVGSGTDVRVFDLEGASYVAQSFLPDTLEHAAGEFMFTDTTGNQITFFDFDQALPEKQRGQFKSSTDAAGNTTYVAAWTTDGDIAEVRRQDAAGVDGEAWTYTYHGSGTTHEGMIQNVQLRRPDGQGGWDIARQVDYTYYGEAEDHGHLGDLKTATIKDPAGNTIDTKYYRYYKFGEADGYGHALKYVFEPKSFANLSAAVADPFTATDAEIAPYATHYFEFDTRHRTTRHDIQGMADSDGGGIGTYLYSYTTSDNPDGANSWKYKTIETLPDGNQNTIYCNSMGEVMLEVFDNLNDPAKPTLEGQQWITFNYYDADGRLLWEAQPSAVTGFDETSCDLLVDQAGNFLYLADTVGLINTTSYYLSTTATDTVAGGVAGYVQSQAVQQGELGTATLISSQDYLIVTAGGTTVCPEASETIYANADGTGARTTTYSYTWFTGTTAVESRTTTLPVVTVEQNGSGTADNFTEFYDAFGRTTWMRDAAGHISYAAYDAATGAVTRRIADVDTTQTTDFEDLPTGWVTPTDGGLHLITETQVDGLGRTISQTDANGHVTYTVYHDASHETRIYAGWNDTTDAPTGPVTVIRADRAGNYTETITMSAAPGLTGGLPDGSEVIADIESLSRTYFDASNRAVTSDTYFDLTGLTYTTSTSLGVEGVNYNRTTYEYDVHDQRSRVENAVGTISVTLYDGLGRATAEYIGTDDSTTDGLAWTPANASATSNMALVTAYIYDNDAVGDGNLTHTTRYPDTNPRPRPHDASAL
jgi:Ca2+-binding RTX toxin-like protein